MSFTPRPSKAVKLWLGAVVIVLLLLFLQTRGKGSGDYNFFLNTNSDAIDSEVYVDNNLMGKVSTPSASGLGGGAFWGHLTAGKHRITVKKANYQPFEKDMEMHGKAYLGVDLKPLKD